MSQNGHKQALRRAAENYGRIGDELARIQEELQSARRVALVAVGAQGGAEPARLVRQGADLLASEEESPIAAAIGVIVRIGVELIRLEMEI